PDPGSHAQFSRVSAILQQFAQSLPQPPYLLAGVAVGLLVMAVVAAALADAAGVGGVSHGVGLLSGRGRSARVDGAVIAAFGGLVPKPLHLGQKFSTIVFGVRTVRVGIDVARPPLDLLQPGGG